MGQQQILLIVLSVILVGIAIAVGITMFQAQALQGNLDAIVVDLNNLASMAFSYRIRPLSMGGGGHSYEGFHNFFLQLPDGLRDNSNATYTVEATDIGHEGVNVRIKAVSKYDEDIERWILVDHTGNMSIHVEEPSVAEAP